MNKIKTLVTLITLIFSSQLMAFDSNRLCERFKSCMLEGMNAEEMPADIKQMMQPMVDNICAVMNEKFKKIKNKAEQDLEACFNAMSVASCDVLMNNTDQINECAFLNK